MKETKNGLSIEYIGPDSYKKIIDDIYDLFIAGQTKIITRGEKDKKKETEVIEKIKEIICKHLPILDSVLDSKVKISFLTTLENELTKSVDDSELHNKFENQSARDFKPHNGPGNSIYPRLDEHRFFLNVKKAIKEIKEEL